MLSICTPTGLTDKEIVASFIVEGVEHDSYPIVAPRLITVGEMGPNGLRVWIVGPKTHIEAVRVVHRPGPR